MKVREKLTTVLFMFLLLACLSLTAQSVLRTALRCTASLGRITSQYLAKAPETFAAGSAYKDNLRWTFTDSVLTINEMNSKTPPSKPYGPKVSFTDIAKVNADAARTSTRTFYHGKLSGHLPAADLKGNKKGSLMFSAAARQIISYISFFILYLQTILQYL